MICGKCENILFTIQDIPCCSECSENDAWNHETEEYTRDEKLILEKGLERLHVEENGECAYGPAYGAGCYLFTCGKCHQKFNLASSDSC